MDHEGSDHRGLVASSIARTGGVVDLLPEGRFSCVARMRKADTVEFLGTT